MSCWRAYGASVRGTGHRLTDLPCQDAHGWRLFQTGVLCAVADGLGSAARADAGAQRAVAAALEALESSLPWQRIDRGGPLLVPPQSVPVPPDQTAIESSIRAAFAAARAALESAADDATPSDYATTLLLAAATDDWTAVGQIGDGAMVARWPDGQLETLSLPQRGEYANETTPLTAGDALERVQVRVWRRPVRALVLFSDGLQGLAINLASGKPFEPFFAPFVEALAEPFDPGATGERLAAFLDSARVCARSDDDKTLLVVGVPSQA